MRSLVLCACALGCGGRTAAAPDAAIAIDSAPPDAPADAPAYLACVGQPPPTAAADPVAFGGKVFAIDHYAVTPVVGATVVLHARVGDTAVAQATTASDGTFAMTVASHGAPVDAYYTVAATDALPTREDPGTPLVGGEDALLVVANDAELARWAADAGTPYVAGAGTLLATVVDCDGKPVIGSTIAVAGASSVTYYDDVAKRWDPALAASTNGFALVGGAPATAVLRATIGSLAWSRTTLAPPGTLAIAVLPPIRR